MSIVLIGEDADPTTGLNQFDEAYCLELGPSILIEHSNIGIGSLYFQTERSRVRDVGYTFEPTPMISIIDGYRCDRGLRMVSAKPPVIIQWNELFASIKAMLLDEELYEHQNPLEKELAAIGLKVKVRYHGVDGKKQTLMLGDDLTSWERVIQDQYPGQGRLRWISNWKLV